MILAVDVQYKSTSATIGGVLFEHWQDSAPIQELVSHLNGIEEYEPGKFYKRELPCILHLIDQFDLKPQVIIVDGLVFLDGDSQPGLGKYLYDVLSGKVAVVGVAKKPFRGIPDQCKLFRGNSKRALYVTSVGIGLDAAKGYVHSMYGQHRLPDLVKRADQLSRETIEQT